MGKYDMCKESRLVMVLGKLVIQKCVLKRRHAGKHTTGWVEW